jgi:hypothetical protein
MVKPCAHAYLATLEALQRVDLSAPLTLIVHKTKLAAIKNVETHVLELAESVPNVLLSITILSVAAPQDSLEIHLFVANQ